MLKENKAPGVDGLPPESFNGKLNEAQFGFREGRRTIDPIFIISTAIQAYKKKCKPLHACFVNFAKAFDSIKHSLL